MVLPDHNPIPVKADSPSTPEILRPGSEVLVFGGSAPGSTGKVLSEKLLDLGVNVTAGTRYSRHHEKLTGELMELGAIGEEHTLRLSPMIQDLTDYDATKTALDGMNLSDSHIIYSAAGGAEKFSRELLSRLGKTRKAPLEERAEMLSVLNEDMLERSQRYRDDAFAINYYAPINILEHMIKNSDDNSATRYFVDLSSLGAFFFASNLPVPSFYTAIAEAKYEFSRWLHENKKRLMNAEILPVEILCTLLRDSKMAFILTAINELACEEDKIDPGRFPVMADLANAAIQILQGKFDFDDYPAYLYITKPGKIDIEVPGEEAYNALMHLPLFGRNFLE